MAVSPSPRVVQQPPGPRMVASASALLYRESDSRFARGRNMTHVVAGEFVGAIRHECGQTARELGRVEKVSNHRCDVVDGGREPVERVSELVLFEARREDGLLEVLGADQKPRPSPE